MLDGWPFLLAANSGECKNNNNNNLLRSWFSINFSTFYWYSLGAWSVTSRLYVLQIYNKHILCNSNNITETVQVIGQQCLLIYWMLIFVQRQEHFNWTQFNWAFVSLIVNCILIKLKNTNHNWRVQIEMNRIFIHSMQ